MVAGKQRALAVSGGGGRYEEGVVARTGLSLCEVGWGVCATPGDFIRTAESGAAKCATTTDAA